MSGTYIYIYTQYVYYKLYMAIWYVHKSQRTMKNPHLELQWCLKWTTVGRQAAKLCNQMKRHKALKMSPNPELLLVPNEKKQTFSFFRDCSFWSPKYPLWDPIACHGLLFQNFQVHNSLQCQKCGQVALGLKMSTSWCWANRFGRLVLVKSWAYL